MNPTARVTSWRGALRVTPVEWALALCQLAVAVAGFLFSDYSGLSLAIEAILVTGLILAFVSLHSAFGTRTIGKAMLTWSVLFYFWLEAHYLVWADPPFLVAAAPMGISQYEPGLVQQGLFYVALFQLALLAGYSIKPRLSGLAAWVQRRAESPTHFASFARYGLALSGTLTLLWSYSFDVNTTYEAALASRSRAVLPTVDVGPLLYISYFSFFAASYFLIRALVLKDRRPWVIAGAVLALLPPLLSGTRHYLAYIAVPILAVVVTRIKGKISRGRVFKWCVIGILLLLACQLQFHVRALGWDHLDQIELSRIANLNVTYQFSAMLFALHLVPNQHDYFREFMEPYFLMHWIPRYFWPEKPVINSWSYYTDVYTRGSATWNATPSVIGQFHMNWGLPGVIFAGIWMGFLARVADLAFSSIQAGAQPAVAVAIGMVYAFVCCSFRIYSPMYFSYLVFGIVGMLLITRSRRATRQPVRQLAFARGPAPAA